MRIKHLVIIFFSMLAAFCDAAESAKTVVKESKNEVYLLPTLHRNHERKGQFYDLKHLAKVVAEIKADVICAEITPESLANLQFFPEYTKVILRLQKDLGYKVVPCSAWTAERNFKTVGVKAMDKAHYALIAKALDRYSNQGKRIVISFGGGHITGLLQQLKVRKDVRIVDYRIKLNEQRKAYLEAKVE